MRSNIRLFSWNPKSEGAKVLSESLGIKRIKHKGSQFKGSNSKTIINWGSSNLPEELFTCNIINNPTNVSAVSDKLQFFKLLEGQFDPSLLVPWTTDFNEAISWLKTKEDYVLARTKLRASGGDGIVMMHKDEPNKFVKAPLYTKYVKKSDEYRVHVCGGQVFLVQRKGLRKTDDAGNPIDPKQVDWKIRNLSNGFIFARSDIKAPDIVLDAAVKIFPLLGLDFYAADIIYNTTSNRCYVLEVNSAPGLTGSTIGDYTKVLLEHLKVA